MYSRLVFVQSNLRLRSLGISHDHFLILLFMKLTCAANQCTFIHPVKHTVNSTPHPNLNKYINKEILLLQGFQGK